MNRYCVSLMFALLLAPGPAAASLAVPQRPPDRNPNEGVDWGNNGLSLLIDLTRDTFTFTGDDSATIPPRFSADGFAGTALWVMGTPTGAFDTVDIFAGFEGFDGAIAPPQLTTGRQLLVYANGSVGLLLQLIHPNEPFARFRGTGVPISYADLISPENEGFLATLDGQSLEASTLDGPGGTIATNFSPIAISVVSVPEPSMFGAWAFIVTALVPRRRRR